MTAITAESPTSTVDQDYAKIEKEITLSFDSELDPSSIDSTIEKPLSERVKLVREEGNDAIYKIDDCLNLRGPSQAYRDRILQSKNLEYSTYDKRLKWSLLGTVVSPLIYPLSPTVCFISLIVSGLFASLNWLKKRDIAEEIKPWRISDEQRIAEERAKGYKEGFPYVYRRDLKSSSTSACPFLHPAEVSYLYKESLSNFCKKLLEQFPSTQEERDQWMNDFFTLNPLSPTLMAYGIEEAPEFLKTASLSYKELLLSSGETTPERLYSKFTTYLPIGPIDPQGKTGRFAEGSYEDKLETINIRYERELSDLVCSYQRAVNSLKLNYGHCLKEEHQHALDSLEALNNQFEFDLESIQISFKKQLKNLKNDYNSAIEELNQLFSQYPRAPHPETHLDQKFEEAKKAFHTPSRNLRKSSLEEYLTARLLLEEVIQHLNEVTSAAS